MIREENSVQVKERAEEIAKKMRISLLEKGRPIYLTTSALSSSMYPFIKGGDIIKVAPLKENEIKIGDIIAVDNSDIGRGRYTHRVIEIFSHDDGKFYLTKGDANKHIDEAIRFDSITGKITAIERKGLRINFGHPLWDIYFNKHIARLSARHGKMLRAIAPYISLVIERRWFFSKLKKRIKRANAARDNTQELILICARVNIEEGLIERAKERLERGIDWEFFMEAAMGSGVHLLFYNSLNKISQLITIPQEFIDRLKAAYLYALSKMIFQHRETTGLLKLFFQRNIPVILLKGSLLSKRIYGDIASRGLSVDIDLLVEEKNRETAKKLLEEFGYVFSPDKAVKTELLWQHMFTKSGSAAVDLHWEIIPTILESERIKGLWRGIRLNKENGVCHYEFKEEELLFQLSLHLVNNFHTVQLRYICDINELLTRYKDALDWGSIVEKAKKLNLSSSLYTNLVLSKGLFGTPVPQKALAKLKPGLLKSVFIKIFANKKVVLDRDCWQRQFMRYFLWHLFFSLLEARSIRDYFTIIFPPREKMGGKTYAQRLTRGLYRFIQGLKGTRTQ